MGCGSRFWVGWAGVLGQSLVEFGWLVEFGSAFFHLWFVGWLRFFLFFSFFLRFLDFEFVAVDVVDDNWNEIIYYFNV